jgi:hypothetical protein
MKYRATLYSYPRFLGLVLTGLIAVNCVALPPSQPARDIKAIAGNWHGSVQGGGWTRTVEATLTIGQDGRYEVNVIGGEKFPGKIEVVDGKYRYNSDAGRTGTYTLHEGDGQRVLNLVGDEGRSTGQFWPASKP